MLELEIRDEDEELAKQFTNVYSEMKYGKNVLGVSEKKFYDFIFSGKLGELVFRRLLDENNILNQCDEILKPHPGKYKREGADFVLTNSGETIDVKTSDAMYKTRLLVREDQVKAKVHDVYLGQRLNPNKNVIECWGYICGNKLKLRPIEDFGYGPCRSIFLKDLIPIEEFLAKAQNPGFVSKGELICKK